MSSPHEACPAAPGATIWPPATEAGRREHRRLAAELAARPKYGACEGSLPPPPPPPPLSVAEGKAAPEATLLERAARRVPGLGIMLTLMASVFLGTAGMLVKLTHSVHGIQVAVFRALIQLLIYSLVVSVRRVNLWPQRSELAPVAARALLSATSITLSYHALKLIPLGDLTTIRFSLPIWTLVISYFVLGESCNPLKVVAVLVSISGVVLIAKPDDCIYLANLVWRQLGLESEQEFGRHWRDHELAKLRLAHPELAARNHSAGLSDESAASETLDAVRRLPFNGSLSSLAAPDAESTARVHRQLEGCLLALTSSVLLACSLIAMRLCRRTPTEVIIVWVSVVSVIVGTATLAALDEWRLPDNLLDVVYILLNGLCGAIGQWFITSATKIEQSGVIALARTFDIEVAFLYSALLLHEQIRTTSIVGSVLVSSGVIIVVVPKWLSSRKSTADAAAAAAARAADEAAARANQTEAGSKQYASATIVSMAGSNMGRDSAIGSADSSSACSSACSSSDERRAGNRARLEEDFFQPASGGDKVQTRRC